jgi:UPF0716 protein FxsA
MWVFAAILAWPMLEIGLFITVGGWIGLWPGLAVVVLTAFLGMAVMRAQGMAALRDVQRGGVMPVAHGALSMVAGVLLILPGFFTDFLGLLLLLPFVREFVIAHFASKVTFRGFPGGFSSGGFGRPPEGDWVDAEYEEVVVERDKIGREKFDRAED